VKLFHRTSLAPAAVLTAADAFFPGLGLLMTANAPRARTFAGPLGTVRLSATAEGGHYTFVQADSDQAGESRLDKTVKKFFVHLHTAADPRHALEAGY
jgi:hypothetical protein